MKTRKLADIADLNQLKLFDYQLEAIEEETLLITGDNGGPEYFRVEITFLGVAYIACPLYIDGPVLWQLASPEEAASVIQCYDDPYSIKVFCVAEDFAMYDPDPAVRQKMNAELLRHMKSPKREPRKFFIVASNVEMTLYYHED